MVAHRSEFAIVVGATSIVGFCLERSVWVYIVMKIEQLSFRCADVINVKTDLTFCVNVWSDNTGAHGVGRRHIKNTLISMHPKRFAYPIPRKHAHNMTDLCG